MHACNQISKWPPILSTYLLLTSRPEPMRMDQVLLLYALRGAIWSLSLYIYIYRYRRVPFSSSCFEQIVYGRSLLNDQIHMTFFPTSSIRMLVAISIGHQHFLEKDPLSSPRHDGRLTIGHATYEPPLGTVHATYVYVPSYLACKWPHQPIKVCRVTCQPTVSWLRFLFWLIFKQ